MTNVQMILSKTDDGLQVFRNYLGDDITKLFRNPYREDSRPSCKIYYRRDRYVLHDFGCSDWNGDCFDFVARVCNLDIRKSFVEILNVINNQLSLCLDFSVPNNQTEERAQETALPIRKIPDVKSKVIEFKATCNSSFSNEELLYWSSYGITEEILNKYDVRSIKKCRIMSVGKKFTLYSLPEHPLFGYFHSEGKGVKIYNPKNKVRFMYAGKRLSPYVFGYDQLPPIGDVVIITGGEKDTMTLASHGYAAMCFNSETATIPELYIESLTERFNNIVIMYDSDETGRRESKHQVELLEKRGYKNVISCTLPLRGTKEEKDVSDLFRKYGASRAKEIIDQLLYDNENRKALIRYEWQLPIKYGSIQTVTTSHGIEDVLSLLGFSKNLSSLSVLSMVKIEPHTGITLQRWKSGCEIIYMHDGNKSVYVGRLNCMFIPPLRSTKVSVGKKCFVFVSLYDYLAYQDICMNKLDMNTEYPPINDSMVIIAGSNMNYSNLVIEADNYEKIYSVLPNTDAEISLLMWLSERKGESVTDLSYLYTKEKSLYRYMRTLKGGKSESC